jgi:hypothetical protein
VFTSILISEGVALLERSPEAKAHKQARRTKEVVSAAERGIKASARDPQGERLFTKEKDPSGPFVLKRWTKRGPFKTAKPGAVAPFNLSKHQELRKSAHSSYKRVFPVGKDDKRAWKARIVRDAEKGPLPLP